MLDTLLDTPETAYEPPVDHGDDQDARFKPSLDPDVIDQYDELKRRVTEKYLKPRGLSMGMIDGGNRSLTDQARYQAEGRGAAPGKSLHQHGKALDFTFFDQNGNRVPDVNLKHQVGAEAESLGFRSGHRFNDPGHLEWNPGRTLRDMQPGFQLDPTALAKYQKSGYIHVGDDDTSDERQSDLKVGQKIDPAELKKMVDSGSAVIDDSASPDLSTLKAGDKLTPDQMKQLAASGHIAVDDSVKPSALPPTAPAPAGPHFQAQNSINPSAAASRVHQGTAAQIQQGLQNPPKVDPAYTEALKKAASDRAAMMQEYNEKNRQLMEMGDDADPQLRSDIQQLRAQVQMTSAQMVAQQSQFEQIGKARAQVFATALDRVKNDPKHKEQAIIELGHYGPVSPEEAAQLGISQSYIHNAMMSVAKSGTEFLGSVGRAAKYLPLQGIASQIGSDQSPGGQLESTMQDAQHQLEAQRNVYGKDGVGGQVVSGVGEMLPDLVIAGLTAGESLPAQAAKFGVITGAKAFGRGEDAIGVLKSAAFGAGGVLTGHALGKVAPEFAESVLGEMGVRAGGNAILGGLWTAAEGGDTKAVTSSAILFGVQGIFGGGEDPKRAAEMLKSPEIREAVEQHIADPVKFSVDDIAEAVQRTGLAPEEAQKFAENIDILKSASESPVKDELFDQAVSIINEIGKPSTAELQKRLHIGYGRATDILDQIKRESASSTAPELTKGVKQENTTTPESSPIERDEQGRVVRKFGSIPEHPLPSSEPVEPVQSKQPWEMTRGEYIDKVNPGRKRLEPEERPSVSSDDIEGMAEGKRVSSHRLLSGESVQILKDESGTYYAKIGDKTVGYIGQLPNGEVDMTVASDFQRKGIGSILNSVFRQENPFVESGGLTEGGERTVAQTHKQFVAEALSRNETIKPEVLADYPDLQSVPQKVEGSKAVPEVHEGQIFDYRNQRYRVDSVDDEHIRATDLSGKEGMRVFQREDFERVTTIPGRKIHTREEVEQNAGAAKIPVEQAKPSYQRTEEGARSALDRIRARQLERQKASESKPEVKPQEAPKAEEAVASTKPEPGTLSIKRPSAPVSLKFVKPKSVESPGHGMLEGAKRAKAVAGKQVDILQARLGKATARDNKGSIRMDLQVARGKLEEARTMEAQARAKIEEDANRQGLTTKRPKPPKGEYEDRSISEFARRPTATNRGFKADSDLQGEINRLRMRESGTTGLFSKDGLSPDKMREAAVEAGYLPEDATISDLIDAIEDDLAGKKTYSIHRDQNIIDKQLEKDYEAHLQREEASKDFKRDAELLKHVYSDESEHEISKAFSRLVESDRAYPDTSEFENTARAHGLSEEATREALLEARRAREESVQFGGFEESDNQGGKSEIEQFQQDIDRAEVAGKLETEKNAAKAKAENDKELLRIGMKAGRGTIEEKAPTARKDTKTPDLFDTQIDLPTASSGEQNTIFTKENADAALDRVLNPDKNKRHSGPISDEELKDWLYVAGYHIERGIRTFADFSRQMVLDIGDEVKPYLRELFEKAHGELGERPPTEVGIKNKVTDAELESQGKPKIDTSDQKRSFDQVVESGRDAVDKGRINPGHLAEQIANKPRPLTPEETASLLYHKTQLLNHEDAIMKELRGHRESGDLDAEIDARGRLQAVQESLDTARVASRKSGYEQGLGLAIRRIMMERDYSLSRMIDRAEAANNGKPLTESQKLDFEKLRDTIMKYEDDWKAYDERQSKGAATKTVTEIRKEAAAERKSGRKQTKSTLDSEFASQKAMLAKLFSRDSNGPGKGLGGREAGAVDPELLGLPVEALKLLRDMAKNRLQSGITTVDGVVDSIHEAVADVMGGVTKRQIRDLISGYGKTSKPNPEALAVAMRELTAGMRDVSAEEDILSGKAPERSGYQRGPATPEARARRQRLNQLMREHGIEIERQGRSPEEQQKSALDAVKTRLKNAIQDIQRQIDTGEKPKGKTPVPLDEEAKGLVAQRDSLRAVLDSIQGPRTKSEESVIQARKDGLRKQIAVLDERLGGKEPAPKPDVKTDYDDETHALMAERDILKRQLSDPTAKNKAAVKAKLEETESRLAKGDIAKRETAFPSRIYDDAETAAMRKQLQDLNRQINDARSLPDKMAKLEKQIADVKERIANSDYAKRPAAEKLSRPAPKEIVDLRAELKAANEQLSKAKQEATAQESINKRITELQRRIRERDFSRAARPEANPVSPEVAKLRDHRARLQEEYDKLKPPTPMTDAQRIATAERGLQKSIDEMQRQIDAGKVTIKDKSDPVTSKRIEDLKAQKAKLQDVFDKLKESDPEVQKKSDAAKLKQLKDRMQKRFDSLQQQVATGKFYRNAQGKLVTSKPRVPFAGLDPEAQAIKANVAKAQAAAEAKIKSIELANRSVPEKIMDKAAKIRRFIVLSSGTAIEKLSAAGATRQISDPIEAAVGGVISKTPGLRTIAAKAPREGAFKPSVEAQASALYIKKMLDLSRFKETLKIGKGKLDLIHGGKEYFDSDSKTDRILGFYNRLHAALKEPVKEAEFFRSTQYRTDQAIKSGMDITDAKVRDNIAAQAYLDANRKVFMNPNWATDGYQGLIKKLEHYQGEGEDAAKVFATTMKILFPVVRVPTNYLMETVSYSPAGFGKSGYRLFKKGIKDLSPEDADYVMRNLKKGLVGTAAMGIGAGLSQQFGGFFTQGNYSTPEGMKAGEIKVLGVNIPRLFLHHPLIEAMQFGATFAHLHQDREEGSLSSLFDTSLALSEEQPFIGETIRNVHAIEKDKRAPAAGQFVGGLVTPPDLRRLAMILDPKTPTSAMMKLLQGMGVQSTDPMYRPPKTFGEGFKSGFPYFRKDIEEKNIKPQRPPKPTR